MVQIKISFNEEATNLPEFVGLNSNGGEIINNKIKQTIDEISEDPSTDVRAEGVEIDQRTVVKKVLENFNTQEIVLLATNFIANKTAEVIKSKQENPLMQLMKAMLEATED